MIGESSLASPVFDSYGEAVGAIGVVVPSGDPSATRSATWCARRRERSPASWAPPPGRPAPRSCNDADLRPDASEGWRDRGPGSCTRRSAYLSRDYARGCEDLPGRSITKSAARSHRTTPRALRSAVRPTSPREVIHPVENECPADAAVVEVPGVDLRRVWIPGSEVLPVRQNKPARVGCVKGDPGPDGVRRVRRFEGAFRDRTLSIGRAPACKHMTRYA